MSKRRSGRHVRPLRPSSSIGDQSKKRYGHVDFRKDLPLIQTQPVPDVPDIVHGTSQCPGCGSLLQTTDVHGEGYIDPRAVEKWMHEQETFEHLKEIFGGGGGGGVHSRERRGDGGSSRKQKEEERETDTSVQRNSGVEDERLRLKKHVAETMGSVPAAGGGAGAGAAAAAAAAAERDDFFEDVLFAPVQSGGSEVEKDGKEAEAAALGEELGYEYLDEGWYGEEVMDDMGEVGAEEGRNVYWDALLPEEQQALLSEMERSRDKEGASLLLEDDSDAPFVDLEDVKLFERMEKQQHSRSLVCMRCHQLKHYGHSVSFGAFDIPPEHFYEKLKETLHNDKRALVVKIVDLFDLENSVIPKFDEIVTDTNRLLLVGNKLDLMPKDTSLLRVESWLRRAVRQQLGDKLQFRDVVLVSSTSGLNIKALAARIEKLRKTENVYIVGSSNVGKSTLINKLIYVVNPPLEMMLEQQRRQEEEVKRMQRLQRKAEELNDRKLFEEYKRQYESDGYKKNEGLIPSKSVLDVRRYVGRLTESQLPGTTLKAISFILLNRDMSRERIRKEGETVVSHAKKTARLFDTPGVINPALASNYLQPSEWKYAQPKSRIKPRRIRLRPGRTIFIGGIARIDYDSNDIDPKDWDRVFFTLFVSNDLPIHTTSTAKADQFYEKHIGGLIFPPQAPPPPKPSKKEKKEMERLKRELKAKSKNETPEERARRQSEEHRQREEEDRQRRMEFIRESNLYPLSKKESYQIEGYTRAEAICDIAISGLGWVSLTGVGNIKVSVHVPKVLQIYIREPLMPFETFGKLFKGRDFVDG